MLRILKSFNDLLAVLQIVISHLFNIFLLLIITFLLLTLSINFPKFIKSIVLNENLLIIFFLLISGYYLIICLRPYPKPSVDSSCNQMLSIGCDFNIFNFTIK